MSTVQHEIDRLCMHQISVCCDQRTFRTEFSYHCHEIQSRALQSEVIERVVQRPPASKVRCGADSIAEIKVSRHSADRLFPSILLQSNVKMRLKQ